jgi:chromosome segregation ATPase
VRESVTAIQPEAPAEPSPGQREEKAPGLLKRKLQDSQTALHQVVREKSQTLGLDRGVRRVTESARDLKDYLQGKPEIVDKIARLKDAFQAKKAQLQALDATAESISRETYQSLREQYLREIKDIKKQYAELQPQLDRQHGEYLAMQTQLKGQIDKLQQRQAELERLREARAIAAADARKQEKELQREISTLTAQLAACEKNLAYLEPHARARKTAEI